MSRPNRYSPEVRERAVRMVFEHESEYESQWAAIRSIADEDRVFDRDAAEVGPAGRDGCGDAGPG